MSNESRRKIIIFSVLVFIGAAILIFTKGTIQTVSLIIFLSLVILVLTMLVDSGSEFDRKHIKILRQNNNEILRRLNEINEKMEKENDLPHSPEREADFDSWKLAYNLIIVPARQQQKKIDEIIEMLGKAGYPNSKKTYRKIIKAGDAGALEKFRQRKKGKVKANSDQL